MNAAPVIVERLVSMDEPRTSGAVREHYGSSTTSQQRFAVFECAQWFAGGRIDDMKVVEYVEQQPSLHLPIEHFDKCVTVASEIVKRESPLPCLEPRGVGKGEKYPDKIGAIAITVLYCAIGSNEVLPDWTLVPRALDQMRRQHYRNIPIATQFSHAKRVHDRAKLRARFATLDLEV